jgi:hypothetical protein
MLKKLRVKNDYDSHRSTSLEYLQYKEISYFSLTLYNKFVKKRMFFLCKPRGYKNSKTHSQINLYTKIVAHIRMK